MTKAISRVGAVLVVTVLLSGPAFAPAAQSAAAMPNAQQPTGSPWSAAEPAPTGEFTEMLVRDLTASGFQVSEGYSALYAVEDCIDHTYPSLKNCFLANPAAPYVISVVKSWPDEYVDPAAMNVYVETKPGYSSTYRLDPREAIVIFGEMPPPGRYMGLQTWEFSEHGKWKAKDFNQWANTPDLAIPMQYLFDTIPPNDPKSQRVISCSALGDVVNNVVMERQSGYPFGETRYFIVTPSPTTDQAVRHALQRLGVPDTYIFTEQIPQRDEFGVIGPLGMGKNAIDFATLFRYAVPEPGYIDAAEAWRQNPPLTVLRVRGSRGAVTRYPFLIFEPRSANSEAPLASDLEDLVAAVCDNVSSHSNLTSTDCTQPPPASSFIPELVRDYGWAGPYCRAIGMDCQADQQEAALYFSSPRSLRSGQVLAVIGTLATETGNATYVGLAANDASMMAGVANVLDTDFNDLKGLKGSADGYATTVNNTGKFFVHYFTKECASLEAVPGAMENCSRTDGIQVQPPLGDPALRDMFIITLRDYIATGTQRGPDPSKLLTPRLLTFTRP